LIYIYILNILGDPFYEYIQFPSKTTTLASLKIIDVDTDNQCAYACTLVFPNFFTKTFNRYYFKTLKEMNKALIVKVLTYVNKTKNINVF
jgi:hypothetical protein